MYALALALFLAVAEAPAICLAVAVTSRFALSLTRMRAPWCRMWCARVENFSGMCRLRSEAAQRQEAIVAHRPRRRPRLIAQQPRVRHEDLPVHVQEGPH